MACTARPGYQAAMHLRDALITTEGSIVAQGAMEFPPDGSGRFACPPHDHLIIDLAPLNARIIPATVVPDAATGYMRARPAGGWLSLPASLDRTFRIGLNRLGSSPLSARADHEEGWLASSLDPFTQTDQALGRCVLQLTRTPEAVEFTLAAELRAAHPFPDWNKSARNYWGEDGAPAGLSARFRVNAATSYLARGAIDVSRSPIVEREVFPFDGHEGPMLDRSVVEVTGLLLAGSPDGQAWRIFTGLRGPGGERETGLSLRRARLHRRENGLFEAEADDYRTFRCAAFTLESVMRQLRPGRRLQLSARGGDVAFLDTGTREVESHGFDSVGLSAEAIPAGVAILIEAAFDRSGAPSPERMTRIEFTVPRETLLARYPRQHSRLYGPL